MHSPDFQDELGAAQTGDEQAFATLFRAVQPMRRPTPPGYVYEYGETSPTRTAPS